jgi:holliday junction DNA helicase RuvA
MIALLRGRIASREADALVLDVHGVGYLVHAPASTVASLPADEDVLLHISTIVREDAITLYGFADPTSRRLFDTLRDVNGVGPRIAVALLSTLSPGALALAVESDDVSALAKAHGVGRKLAARLCLELKGKLSLDFQPTELVPPPPRKPTDPLALALAQLDYRKSDIDRALADPTVPGPDQASIEDRLRAALRSLSRQG